MTIEDEKRELTVSAVAAIYGAERADSASILNTSLSLVAAGVAYLIGTIAFWDKFDLLGGWIVLLPFPLACVSAFHSVLLALAAVRTTSVLLLEELLKEAARISKRIDCDAIGAMAGERVMNMQRAHSWYLKASSVLAYGGVGAIILGYTTIVLMRSAGYIGAWVIAPTIGYMAFVQLWPARGSRQFCCWQSACLTWDRSVRYNCRGGHSRILGAPRDG